MIPSSMPMILTNESAPMSVNTGNLLWLINIFIRF
jgi:hypothetical protein